MAPAGKPGRFREAVDRWHNVLAPNSFRKRMARQLVKRMVAEYGDNIGAVYLAGSTASRRAMQDSSVNMVVFLKSKGSEFTEHKKGIYKMAKEIDRYGAPDSKGGYFTGLVFEANPKNYTADILQPEKVLLYGKEFARREGLPLKVKSREKRRRYIEGPKFDVAPNASNVRATNPITRRPLLGIPERIRIERAKGRDR